MSHFLDRALLSLLAGVVFLMGFCVGIHVINADPDIPYWAPIILFHVVAGLAGEALVIRASQSLRD